MEERMLILYYIDNQTAVQRSIWVHMSSVTTTVDSIQNNQSQQVMAFQLHLTPITKDSTGAD